MTFKGCSSWSQISVCWRIISTQTLGHPSSMNDRVCTQSTLVTILIHSSRLSQDKQSTCQLRRPRLKAWRCCSSISIKSCQNTRKSYSQKGSSYLRLWTSKTEPKETINSTKVWTTWSPTSNRCRTNTSSSKQSSLSNTPRTLTQLPQNFLQSMVPSTTSNPRKSKEQLARS